MREVTQLTDYRFLNIKQVVDPENHVRGYQFAERLGKDSIAFVCYDEEIGLVLLNEEYKPPIGSFVITAFGGSLDKAKDLKKIVQEEVGEEAGFEVEFKDIIDLGKAFVSTQMNQFCHLYLVYVDRSKQKEKHPENAIEASAKTIWYPINDAFYSELQDWKAITIIAKAEKEGLL